MNPRVEKAITTTAPGIDCCDPKCECLSEGMTVEEPVWNLHNPVPVDRGDVFWSASHFEPDRHYLPSRRAVQNRTYGYWAIEGARVVDALLFVMYAAVYKTRHDSEGVT